MFKWNFLYFSLCLLPLVLSLGKNEKSLAPCVSFLPIRNLYTLIIIFLSLLEAKQSQLFHHLLICQILHFPNRVHGPSLNSLQYVQGPTVLGSLDIDQEVWLWSQHG